jgi:hypothetical protein
VNAGNAGAGAFEITSAEVGAGFSYTITSDGGAGSVSGSGTISGATQAVAGLDLSGLADGTLTVSVVLTDGLGNAGAAVSDTVVKTSTLDCTNPAALGGATAGMACADGSIYAGSLNGNHLITHASGCGNEPGARAGRRRARRSRRRARGRQTAFGSAGPAGARSRVQDRRLTAAATRTS